MSERDLAGLGFVVNPASKEDNGPESYKNYNTIFDLIGEKFTGVVVNGSNIKIRGSAVLTGNMNAEALFVVDGSYVSDISYILPVEVKNIEIPKGGDATLYGSRGGHGVIIITPIK